MKTVARILVLLPALILLAVLIVVGLSPSECKWDDLKNLGLCDVSVKYK